MLETNECKHSKEIVVRWCSKVNKKTKTNYIVLQYK